MGGRVLAPPTVPAWPRNDVTWPPSTGAHALAPTACPQSVSCTRQSDRLQTHILENLSSFCHLACRLPPTLVDPRQVTSRLEHPCLTVLCVRKQCSALDIATSHTLARCRGLATASCSQSTTTPHILRCGPPADISTMSSSHIYMSLSLLGLTCLAGAGVGVGSGIGLMMSQVPCVLMPLGIRILPSVHCVCVRSCSLALHTHSFAAIVPL